MLGIGLIGLEIVEGDDFNQSARAVREHDLFPFGAELEVGVQFIPFLRVQAGGVNDEEFAGAQRHIREAPFGGLGLGVRKAHPVQGNGLTALVVDFDIVVYRAAGRGGVGGVVGHDLGHFDVTGHKFPLAHERSMVFRRVRQAGRILRGNRPVARAIAHVDLVRAQGRHVYGLDYGAVFAAQHHRVAGRTDLKRRVVGAAIGVGVPIVAENQHGFAGLQNVAGEHELRIGIEIVREHQPIQIHGRGTRVEQFHIIGERAVFIRKRGRIGTHYLVDHDIARGGNGGDLLPSFRFRGGHADAVWKPHELGKVGDHQHRRHGERTNGLGQGISHAAAAIRLWHACIPPFVSICVSL